MRGSPGVGIALTSVVVCKSSYLTLRRSAIVRRALQSSDSQTTNMGGARVAGHLKICIFPPPLLIFWLRLKSATRPRVTFDAEMSNSCSTRLHAGSQSARKIAPWKASETETCTRSASRSTAWLKVISLILCWVVLHLFQAIFSASIFCARLSLHYFWNRAILHLFEDSART